MVLLASVFLFCLSEIPILIYNSESLQLTYFVVRVFFERVGQCSAIRHAVFSIQRFGILLLSHNRFCRLDHLGYEYRQEKNISILLICIIITWGSQASCTRQRDYFSVEVQKAISSWEGCVSTRFNCFNKNCWTLENSK